ncbi:hypothetical protein KPL71_008072 [Citrus sinensis]|uniref:Uncharacterized protein n=1 Tax=Citrus sinensis TaxID=2711 RepID=A0ACB8M4S0_CITSI|nr:hypothetical protein KPL71_008072 [Citrus sinensis]
MKIGESVTNYFSSVMLVANDMRNIGEDMSDMKIIEKILRTLTEKFNYIVCSIEESKDIDQLSMDELQSSLLVHEQKFQKNGGDEQALKVTSGERLGSSEEDKFGGRGRATVKCFNCHKLGHFKYECPNWDKNINYAELDEDEEMLLMSYVEMHNSKIEEVWFLDSGCTNHRSGDKRWFIELDESFRQMVKIGNNSKMAVMGNGNIRIQILRTT